MYLGCVIPYSGHGISITVALSQFAKVHGWDPHTIVIGANVTMGLTHTLKSYWAILCIGIFVCSMEMSCHFEHSLPIMMDRLQIQLH